MDTFFSSLASLSFTQNNPLPPEMELLMEDLGTLDQGLPRTPLSPTKVVAPD